ncbi:cation:proton antiporter [Undibacter mobilis]|uniref:Potassium transporter n=1 Tax=Undibacter mobilis TaxID=2292256 RepID=A0A371B1B6_9BRAD|nr:cation:proton antiporter [Undibacter mobilis]RDV01375.1 potassium transporter [Undibacter mobilis]
MTSIRARAAWISLTLLALWLASGPAFAAGEASKGPSEVIFIAQLVALMLTGRLLGEAMLRLGQPAVMGQLLAGILLGPSLFGFLAPDLQHMLFPKSPEQKAMLDGISQAGILLLLLLTGMETDLRLVRATGKASVYASLMGIVVPFGCGVTLGYFMPADMLPHPDHRLITALFLGTALSIASVKIVAMVVREMNFMRRNVGQVILASAIIDDSVGWIIVSIIFSLAMHGEVDALSLAQSVVGTFVFMVVSLTIGRRLVFFAIRWANDVLMSDFAVITAILIIMGAMALTTHLIGVHSVLGAFVAGILVGESPILTKHIDEQLRGLITAFFAPVFFGLAGLSADLTILANPEIAIATAGLILIASIGKFSGAFIGAELGGLTKREGFALACGMNARGSTEVIIASVGLAMGALTPNLFTMIVTMAVVTTLAMPPTLRWALSRIPLSKDEKQRLEREEVEQQGFLAHIERLLLAVDDSTNGTFATRLAGIIAGTHEMPTTVMHITDGDIDDKKHVKKETSKAKDAATIVQEVAERAEHAKTPKEQSLLTLEVSTLVRKPHPDIVAEEAEKGYGAMIVGLDKMVARKNEFHDAVTKLAAGFEGPLLIADARTEHRKHPLHGTISILLPINGTEVSRRAAEVAIAIARASKAPVTALYVAPNGKARSRRAEEAILKDIATMAASYSVDVRTAVRSEAAAGEAILKEAARRNHNVIVLGTGRRPGEKLYFGDTAAALIETAPQSLVFVVS